MKYIFIFILVFYGEMCVTIVWKIGTFFFCKHNKGEQQ